jgi:hypothetical protein
MRLGYAWRIESLYPGIDANKVGARLSELETEHGALTKDLLVREAKSAKSPLHPLFERNAQTALEKWNSKEASNLIHALVVTKNGKKTRESAFVYVEMDKRNRRAYVSLVVAMRTPTLREQVVERGVKEYLRWMRQYGNLPEFRDVRATAKRLKKQIETRMLLAI